MDSRQHRYNSSISFVWTIFGLNVRKLPHFFPNWVSATSNQNGNLLGKNKQKWIEEEELVTLNLSWLLKWFVCLFLWTPLLSINENPSCDVASRLEGSALDPGKKWSIHDLLISYWLLEDGTLVILAIQPSMLKWYRCSFLWSEFSSV